MAYGYTPPYVYAGHHKGWPAKYKAVINYYMQEDARTSYLGRCLNVQEWKTQTRDQVFRRGTQCFCGFIAIMFFIGVITMLCCLNILLVEPHFRAKGFVSTTCNISSFDISVKARCYCVQTKVYYFKGSDLMRTTMFTTEGIHTCSFESICNRNEERKTREVNEYINKMNQTTTYSCYYDPAPNANYVIQNRRYDTDTEAIVSIVISALCFVVSVLMLVCIFGFCGCKYFLVCKPPGYVKTVVNNMNLSGINQNLYSYDYEERKRIIEACERGVMTHDPSMRPASIEPPPSYDHQTGAPPPYNSVYP